MVSPVTVDAMALGELRGARPIAAADVDDLLARREGEPLGDELDQRLGRLARAFRPRPPQPVMDVLAPDRPIGLVELVIMAADVGGGLGRAREDHVHIDRKAISITVPPSTGSGLSG